METFIETHSGKTESEQFKKVILRAINDEPLLRDAALRPDGVVMVCSERSLEDWTKGVRNNWLGWPRRDVYLFDVALFKRFRRLYQTQQREKLQVAWLALEGQSDLPVLKIA